MVAGLSKSTRAGFNFGILVIVDCDGIEFGFRFAINRQVGMTVMAQSLYKLTGNYDGSNRPKCLRILRYSSDRSLLLHQFPHIIRAGICYIRCQISAITCDVQQTLGDSRAPSLPSLFSDRSRF